ncbi:MAG: hypothetical protein Q4F95_14465 [Oscillospiraceae bacterium]|nr:hypothetical protein [Oscillospiraceae bacterium]
MKKNTDAVKQNLLRKQNIINSSGALCNWTLAQNKKTHTVKSIQETGGSGRCGAKIVVKVNESHTHVSGQTGFQLIPSAEFLKTQKKHVRRQAHVYHEDASESVSYFLRRN